MLRARSAYRWTSPVALPSVEPFCLTRGRFVITVILIIIFFQISLKGGGEYKTKSGLGLVWQRNYSDFFRTTTEMVSLRHSESPL